MYLYVTKHHMIDENKNRHIYYLIYDDDAEILLIVGITTPYSSFIDIHKDIDKQLDDFTIESHETEVKDKLISEIKNRLAAEGIT